MLLAPWTWDVGSARKIADFLGLPPHPVNQGTFLEPSCVWVGLLETDHLFYADFFLANESWETGAEEEIGEAMFRQKFLELESNLTGILGMPEQRRLTPNPAFRLDYHIWRSSPEPKEGWRSADLLDSAVWPLQKVNLILSREDQVLPMNQELHIYVVPPGSLTCSRKARPDEMPM
jgi:hypothetical protein